MSAREDFRADDWCILRCRGQATLGLAATLTEDGYEAWSPRETRSIRIPRANVRRTVVLPIMPTYVFARATDLIDLLQMAAMPVKSRRRANQPAHASFSVLQIHDKIPLIRDATLDGLRAIEIKRTPRKKATRALDVGAKVGVEGGSFSGMKGEVVRSDTVHTLVAFNEKYSVKINTCLFEENELGELLALMGDAARKKAA